MIKSYYIGGTGSGIRAETKEEFLRYIAEEIDRAEMGGASYFDVEIETDGYYKEDKND